MTRSHAVYMYSLYMLIELRLHTVSMRLVALLAVCQTQAVGNFVEDVNVAIGAAKGLLAGAQRKDGHVGQGVDALGSVVGMVPLMTMPSTPSSGLTKYSLPMGTAGSLGASLCTL